MAKLEPNWDMTSYFPELRGPIYVAFREALDEDVQALQQRARALGPLTSDSIDEFVFLLLRLEDVSARTSRLAGYLGCLAAADARDEEIAKENASASASRAGYEKVFVLVRAALGAASDADFDALAERGELRGAAHFLGRLRESARLKMEPALEELASDLAVTGINAWGRLYDQISGQLEFTLAVPGEAPRRMPVAVTRSLLESPKPEVRRAALVGASAAWESVGEVAAACLNAIAGTRHALYRRRGVESFLDPALFDAAITRRTLDTLLETVEQRAEVARAYLRRKARILGRDRLGFQDLMAPLPVESHERIPYEQAQARVKAAFARMAPDLAEFADRAFARRWIDWQPRPGKRPGGFCSTSPFINESRVFITFNETLGDLSTLAH